MNFTCQYKVARYTCYFIDTARIVCGRGSMKLSGVRLSVRPSHHLIAARHCGRFAAVGPADRRYRSIAARALSSKCEQNSVASVHCRLTLKAKHTHPFNGPFSRTTQVSQYQKGKTNLDFTEARDSEWQWHQLGHMQVCT